jgi:hypothetical protein
MTMISKKREKPTLRWKKCFKMSFQNTFFEKKTLQGLQQGHKFDWGISLRSDLWPNLPLGREGI